MDPKNLPENPTAGVVRRTLRGMDGRIAHVETLAARWSPKRIDDAITAATAPLKAEIDALKAKLDEIVARVTPTPEPVEVAAGSAEAADAATTEGAGA